MNTFTPSNYTNIPSWSDMGGWITWRWNQQDIGACVGETLASTMKSIYARLGIDYDPSPMGIYHDTLAAEGRLRTDGTDPNGVIPLDALNTLVVKGVGPSSLVPYTHENINAIPCQEYYDIAAKHKIVSFEQVKLDPDSHLNTEYSIESAMAEGFTVALGFTVPKWFMYLHGPLEDQDIIDTTVPDYNVNVGNHEVQLKGFDHALNGRSYKLENWWYPWGDENGDGALSATMSGNFISAYVITGVTDGEKIYDFHRTPERNQVNSLYVSLFDRAVDAEGLDYWAHKIINGESMSSVAQDMYSIRPCNGTNVDLVESFYINVLGRAADAEGKAFWVDQLNHRSQGQVVTDIITCIQSYNGTDHDALMSQALFENKEAISAYNAIMCANNNTDIAERVLDNITYNADSVSAAQVWLVGQLHESGWN